MNLRIGNRARKFATAAWVNTRSMRDGRELDGYRLYVSLLGTETQQTAALILGSIREIDERKDDCGEQLFTLLTNRFQQLGEAYESMPIRDFCMLLRDDMFLQKFGTKYRKYGVLKSQITATDLQGEDNLLFLRRMADRRTIGDYGSSNRQRGQGRVRAGETAFMTAEEIMKRKEIDKKKPCFNMVNEGTCSFGDRCKYSHDSQIIQKYKKKKEEANMSSQVTAPTDRLTPEEGIDDFFAMNTMEEYNPSERRTIDLNDACAMYVNEYDTEMEVNSIETTATSLQTWSCDFSEAFYTLPLHETYYCDNDHYYLDYTDDDMLDDDDVPIDSMGSMYSHSRILIRWSTVMVSRQWPIVMVSRQWHTVIGRIPTRLLSNAIVGIMRNPELFSNRYKGCME